MPGRLVAELGHREMTSADLDVPEPRKQPVGLWMDPNTMRRSPMSAGVISNELQNCVRSALADVITSFKQML